MARYFAHKNILSVAILIATFFSAQAINVVHDVDHLNLAHDQLCDIYQSYDNPTQLNNSTKLQPPQYTQPTRQLTYSQVTIESIYQIYLVRAPPVLHSHSV